MTEFWQFWGEHWFLAWSAIWGVSWGGTLIVLYLIGLVRFAVNRLYRTIVISLRGWPPHHLNADGDWVLKNGT